MVPTYTFEVLTKDQTKILQPVMRRSFGLPGYFMAFSVGEHTLVYKEGDTVLGGVICGSFTLRKGERIGMIKYLFTDPSAQGKGVAGHVFQAAMDWFESTGHAEVAGCVEGHNTASSNLFARHGFAMRTTRDQWRRYGKALPKVWFKGNHLLDIGHFWWSKALKETIPNTSAQRHSQSFGAIWVQIIFHALLLIVWLWRPPGGRPPMVILWQAPLVMSIVFGLRFVPLKIAAAVTRYRVVYRAWESGMILATVVALVFGGVFVSYGSYYPPKAVWREDQERHALFKITWPATMVLLVTAALLVFVTPRFTIIDPWADVVRFLRLYVPFMAMFDLLLGLGPLNAGGGGRIRRVYPQLWAVLLAVAIGIFVAGYFV